MKEQLGGWDGDGCVEGRYGGEGRDMAMGGRGMVRGRIGTRLKGGVK